MVIILEQIQQQAKPECMIINCTTRAKHIKLYLKMTTKGFSVQKDTENRTCYNFRDCKYIRYRKHEASRAEEGKC